MKKIFLSVLAVCLISIYVMPNGRLELRRIKHLIEATIERLDPKIPPTLTPPLAPASKPGSAQFCPNEASISFAKTAQLIWFNPNLSGGAHAWVFNGAEVIKALSAYCGQTTLHTELFVQLRGLLTPLRMPTATGGYQDQKQLGTAFLFLLVKRTPAIWNQLSQSEQASIDLIMEVFMYSSTFTTKDEVAGRLGMNGDSNLHRDWNPNYQNGMVGMIIITALYWGFDDFETKLAAYDDVVFINRLRKNHMLNLLATYTNPSRPSGAAVQAGLRKIVNGSVYRFHGITERDVLGLYNYIASRTFSAKVSCGLNNGAGIDGHGKIANCKSLPNVGRKGMILEFDSWDAEGLRSSAYYCWDAWYILNYSRAALQIDGWLASSTLQQNITLAETMNRSQIGSVDLWFKIGPENGGGYFDYAHGQAGETTVLDAGFVSKHGTSANLDLFNILQRNLGMAEIEH